MSLLRRPWRFVSFGKWNGARPKAMSKRGSAQQRRDRASSRFCSIAPTHQHGCHGGDYADCRCAGGWLCLRARLSTDERRQCEVFWYIRMRSKPIAAPACAAWAWQWRSLVISHHRQTDRSHGHIRPLLFVICGCVLRPAGAFQCRNLWFRRASAFSVGLRDRGPDGGTLDGTCYSRRRRGVYLRRRSRLAGRRGRERTLPPAPARSVGGARRGG